MRELYVYYRVAPADAAAAETGVLTLQRRLREEHAGLQARLLRRPELHNGFETWMETYSCNGQGGVTPAQQAAIESAAAALSACIAGPRHTEVFIACA